VSRVAVPEAEVAVHSSQVMSMSRSFASAQVRARLPGRSSGLPTHSRTPGRDAGSTGVLVELVARDGAATNSVAVSTLRSEGCSFGGEQAEMRTPRPRMLRARV